MPYFVKVNTRSQLSFSAITDCLSDVSAFLNTDEEGIQLVGRLIRSPEEGQLAGGFDETWQ